MDTLHANYPDHGGPHQGPDYDEDETDREAPPGTIGQDERRMQVRAYNFWASLLENRDYPSVEMLKPEALPDFGPYSVLLDFTAGVKAPSVRFLGRELARECGLQGQIAHLEDVPRRSLLSRITDHYMQILANQAPIGFEAEFINQRGAKILYRGILLPFSSDDSTIDFIYGVINWKELADAQTTDELLLEIDQALEAMPGFAREGSPLTEWADGPVDDSGVLELTEMLEGVTGREPDQSADQTVSVEGVHFDFTNDGGTDAMADAIDAENMELADWLASAQALAKAAQVSEERSHQALYAAIGRAYDFSIAAKAAPEEFEQLVAEAGLATQDRAPLTPLVKLVFGADYDKTRLTEYASALAHAHRLDIGRGLFADHLVQTAGGLKGVVNEERRLRREESGAAMPMRETAGEKLVRKLRNLVQRPLNEVSPQGKEFTLLLARRLENGEVVLVGEVADDTPLLERAARNLL